MTTPKDKSQEGPYRVEAVTHNGHPVTFRVVGPTDTGLRSWSHMAMSMEVDRLNATYAAGQAAKSSEPEAQPAQAGDLEVILATYPPCVRDDMRKHMSMYPNRSKEEYDKLANEFAFLTSDADRARHAPSPSVEQRVEEIMEVVDEYLDWSGGPMACKHRRIDLRSRLTSLISKR